MPSRSNRSVARTAKKSLFSLNCAPCPDVKTAEEVPLVGFLDIDYLSIRKSERRTVSTGGMASARSDKRSVVLAFVGSPEAQSEGQVPLVIDDF